MSEKKIGDGWTTSDMETKYESISEIKDKLTERNPLPLGMAEFEVFFERIWSGALIKGEPGQEKLLELSCKNALAKEIIHLPASQTHESDIYFINRLRKVATNQICLNVIEETKAQIRAAQAERQAKLAPNGT